MQQVEIMKKTANWFEHWFDTSYYHVLYNHRDDVEAKHFMMNLIHFLELKGGDHILDLPCGKGRHAVFLNSQGLNVTGADLSKNSIDFAKRFENNSLRFKAHDMRNKIVNQYDAIFNLFTSFGYFDEEAVNIEVLKNFKNGIKKDGHIVIDFLNIKKIKKNLIKEEVHLKEGIEFHINRQIENNFLIKNISFRADNEEHNYVEKVQCLSLEKMKEFVNDSHLTVKHVFGNYDLHRFDEDTSDRLILILQ